MQTDKHAGRQRWSTTHWRLWYHVGMDNKLAISLTIATSQFQLSAAGSDLPMMLQSSRNVGASPVAPVTPPYWFNMPFWAARGSGIVSVIGRWNLRRRGSMVTIGLTATRLPSILVTRLGGTGWAYIITHHSLVTNITDDCDCDQ